MYFYQNSKALLNDPICCCCCKVASVVSDSVWPHRQQPARLPPSLGFSRQEHWSRCHFLLQYMKVKSESEVAQLCLTLSDPMDCSPPGSSVHGIFQARGPERLPLPSLKWLYMQDSNRDTDIKNRFLDSVGEGEGGMVWENRLETCMLPYVK